MRINRYIAQSGVTSRRKAEALILAGRVTKNGLVVKELGTVIRDGDVITVDGKEIHPPKEALIVAFYKPYGVTTSMSDEFADKTVADFLPKKWSTLKPAGRLDKHSEGLLIMTNDGNLLNELTHPSFEHEKEYIVSLDHAIDDADLGRLRAGVKLEEGNTGKSEVHRIDEKTFSIVLHQGWKRQIRRMVETVGHHVSSLKRVRVGKLQLGGMLPGEMRPIDREEII